MKVTTAKLQKWGNSQGIRLPKSIVESLSLSLGAELAISLSDDERSITIEPLEDTRPVRGRHKLEDLLEGATAETFAGEIESGEPQGREVW